MDSDEFNNPDSPYGLLKQQKMYPYLGMGSNLVIYDIVRCPSFIPHHIAQKGDVQLLKCYLEDFDWKEITEMINFPDNGGYTPLHLASRFGHLEMVEFLITKGAVVDVEAHDRMKPIHAALIHFHSEIFQVLKKHTKQMQSH